MINLTKRTVAFFKHPFFSNPHTLLFMASFADRSGFNKNVEAQ